MKSWVIHPSRWPSPGVVVEISADGIRMKLTQPKNTNSFKPCPSYKNHMRLCYFCNYRWATRIFNLSIWHGHAWSTITDESRAVEVCVLFCRWIILMFHLYGLVTTAPSYQYFRFGCGGTRSIERKKKAIKLYHKIWDSVNSANYWSSAYHIRGEVTVSASYKTINDRM